MTQQIYILDSFETDYTNVVASDIKLLVDQSEEFATVDELQQKTYENIIATGTINIDVSLYSSIKLHLTGNTVINFINPPTDEETKAITMAVTTADGTQSLGLPSANNYHYSGNFQADERNKFAMEFAHYNASGLEVDVFINQFN